MSAFTDRLYARWRAQNGSDPGQVGAQRRSRPEGYPKDQARHPARDAGASRGGRSLEGAQRRGGDAAPAPVLGAPCGPAPLTCRKSRPIENARTTKQISPGSLFENQGTSSVTRKEVQP